MHAFDPGAYFKFLPLYIRRLLFSGFGTVSFVQDHLTRKFEVLRSLGSIAFVLGFRVRFLGSGSARRVWGLGFRESYWGRHNVPIGPKVVPFWDYLIKFGI